MVKGADEDVIDVEQDRAVCLLGHGAQEFPLGEARGAERHVARNVLDKDRALEDVLYLADTPGDVAHGLLGIRQRQQVMQIAAAYTGPAQMVGDPGRLDAPRQRAERFQIVAVERVARADRQ